MSGQYPMKAPAGIVSACMYDMPWIAGSNDAIWLRLRQLLRAAGVAGVPDLLERGMGPWEVWRSPNLLLAQSCGYPLLKLGGAVQLVATPIYDFSGCEGPRYRSFLVVSHRVGADSVEELRGLRAVANDPDSNSGMNAFRSTIAPYARDGRFFASVAMSGGHVNSLAALRDGVADVTAIDCVSYGLVTRHRPDLLSGLRVIGETAPTPGLPLVTAAATPPETVAILRQALRDVMNDPDLAWHRAALGLIGFTALPREAYDAIAAMEQAAVALGYPVLA